MPISSASINGFTLAISLGAATLTVPGMTQPSHHHYSNQHGLTPYSNVSYKTGFETKKYAKPISDTDKLAIINDVVRKITNDSTPLNERQHTLLTENLFELL